MAEMELGGGRSRSWRERIRTRMAAAGTSVLKLSPNGLLALLCASALIPLGTVGLTGVAAAGVTAAAGIGTNLLSEAISQAIQALRRRIGDDSGSAEDLVRELTIRITDLSERPDTAHGLREEIALVLRESDALGAAIEAAVQSGDQRLRQYLVACFTRLGEDFAAFGDLLTEVNDGVAAIQASIQRQDDEHRRDRAQLHSQSVQLTLIREELAQFGGQERRGIQRSGRALLAADASPYRGLWPFEEEHSRIFYGREQTTAELLTAVAERLTSPGPLVVTGASGVGKSSLLRAGLLVSLARGLLPGLSASRAWPHLLLTPTRNPFEELSARLSNWSGVARDSLQRALQDHPENAHFTVRQALLAARSPGDARLILVIDQFEEVFTLVDERRREAFITCLAQAASARAGALEQPPALVVLSVRGDFLERCAAHPPLLEALRGGSFLVGPMSRTELIRAVTGPAAEAGLEVEPGLLEAVLGDLDSQGHFNAGVLPLLSQAMLSTWENREENRLTIRGYGLGGGVARAVQTSAEDAYEGLLAPHRLALTPHIFRRMTVVAHDGRPALRSANREELYALGQKDDVDAVLNAFATRRLIVLGHHAADIAHECLLQVWPRLRGWLEEDLADHAVYRDLFEDAQDWERSGRDAAYLYRGERLANLRRLIPRWENNPTLPLPLPASARDFLTAAGRAESRAKRIRRALLIALTGLLIVAVTAAVAAVAAQRQAVRVQEEIAGQRDLAVSRRAATQSESLAGQPALSALLATAAWRISPTPEARASMIDAVLRPGRAVLDGHTSEVGSIAFSPDGRLMASGGTADHSVRLWDVAARRQVGEPLAHDGDVTSVAFSPDGRTLAGAGSGAITFWDVATRTPIQPPFTRVDGGSAIAFSPDGHLLASAASGELRLWNVATRESTSVAKTRSLGDIPAAVAFSPTGKVVASVTERNTVRLWDARTHRQIGLAILETGDQITTDPHQLVRTAVTFSPTGRTLAIVSGIEGVVRLFDTATQRMIGRLSGNPSGITSVAFSPDGHTLISVGEDVRLWDVTSRKPIGAALTGHTSTVTAVAASQDGHTVATGSSSGPIRLWDVTASRPSGGALRGRNPNVIALAFSPDSRLLATGAVDNTVRLWDVNGRERMGTTLSRKGNLTAGLAFSPNGRRLAAGTRTSWDVATRKAIPAPPNAGESADAMAFRPDGRVIASAGDDEGGIRLWDATGRSPGRALSGHDTRVTAMAFSPDATTLASGAADGSLRLWDTAARRPRDVPLSGHSQYVVSLAFTSKGDLLASSALDGTVRVWDVRSGKQRGTPLTGQDGYVHTVVFSPDGRTLATANSTSDGTVQLWDVATMRPIGNPVAGPGDYVRAVAFSPDGRLLAIADTEAVRLWETGLPADPYVAACAISARDLTPAEWGQHLDEVAFRTVCRD